MKNPKGKGIAFENKVRRFLEEKGFFLIRQASSTFPDLVAISPKKFFILDGNSFPINQVCFIECKVNKYISSEEKDKLLQLKENYGGRIFKAYPKYSSYSMKEDNIVLDEVN